MEKAVNNSIHFLDTTIIFQNSKLNTNWYRKVTWSGRYLNFLSYQPLKCKKSVVTGLVDRAIILSHNKFHNTDPQLIKNSLINNCYPICFNDKTIKQWLSYIKHKKIISNTVNNNSQININHTVPNIPAKNLAWTTFNSTHCLLSQ